MLSSRLPCMVVLAPRHTNEWKSLCYGPSKGIFNLSITGMSAVLAQRYGAKLHLQECSLHFLDCNATLLTDPILSSGAQEEQPSNIATEFTVSGDTSSSLTPQIYEMHHFPEDLGYTVLVS